MAIVEFLVAGVAEAPLGSAYFYEVGSSTLASVYTDQACSAAAENPYTLDSNGRAEIYTNSPVRVRVEDADGTEVLDVEQAAGTALYADQVNLRDATGYAGTGSYFTGTTVDAALRSALTSFGGTDFYYLTSRTGGSSRTVRSKLEQVFDVRDYMTATEAAAVDHTTCITEAITALKAAGGGTLYFPAGTWYVTSALTIANFSSGIHVVCDGIIRQTGSTFAVFDLTGTTSNVWFDGVHFYGGGTAGSTGAIGIQAAAATNIWVTNCLFTGPDASTGFNRAVSITGGTGSHVCNNSFLRVFGTLATSAVGECIYVNGGDGHVIVGNRGRLAGAANSLVHIASAGTTTVADNTAYQPGSWAIYMTGCSYCTVSGNVSYDCGGGGGTNAQCGCVFVSSTDCTFKGNAAYSSAVDGFRFATATTNCVVSDNVASTNTANGFYFADTMTSGVVSGNTAKTNGNHGFSWNTTSTSADPFSGVVVSSNLAQNNAQRGYSFIGCSFFSVASNTAISNSYTSSTSYPAYYAHPYVVTPGSAEYGGRGMIFASNIAQDIASHRHSTACDYRMHYEVLPTGSNYAYNSYRFVGNVWPVQNIDGTPSSIKPDTTATNYLKAYGRYFPDESNNLSGSRKKVVQISSAAITLDLEDSGSVIIVDTSSNVVAATLPDIGAPGAVPNPDRRNGIWYTFIIEDSTGDQLTISCSGSGDIIRYDTTAATSITNPASDVGSSVTLVSFDGEWYPIHIWPVVNGSSHGWW